MAPKRVRTVQGTCWPCKDRRVICDLVKPECGRCASTGQTCDYSEVKLRWAGGIASRGKYSGQITPAPALKRDLSSIALQRDWQMPYFEREILTRFSMMDQGLGFDCSNFSADSAMCQAINAVANAHRVLRGRVTSPEALLATKQARFNAIKALRENLETTSLEDNGIPTCFSIIVLLCVLDGMIEPHDDDAAALDHFAGGKAILHGCEHVEQITTVQTGPLSLFLSIFATVDLTHVVLTGCKPYFDQAAWKRLLGREAWWTGLGEYEDTFIETMGTLSHLASLANEAHSDRKSTPISELLAAQLMLEQLRQSLSERQATGKEAYALADSSTLAAFCLTYIMTAYIFLYRALGSLDLHHELVQRCVSTGLRAISECRGNSKLIHCVLFPLLTIGSHCTSSNEQEAIKSALLFCADYLSFGSLKVTLDFLGRKWHDSVSNADWWTFFEPLAMTTFLF